MRARERERGAGTGPGCLWADGCVVSETTMKSIHPHNQPAPYVLPAQSLRLHLLSSYCGPFTRREHEREGELMQIRCCFTPSIIRAEGRREIGEGANPLREGAVSISV